MIVWWHWVILGVVLLVVDIALVNIYYLIWFGIGAIAVGGGVLAIPGMPLWLQIVLFGIISASFLLLWLLVMRPHADKKALTAARDELIGSAAVVVRFSGGKGLLRLQKPIGGRDTWRFTSTAVPASGDAVIITDMSQNGTVQAAPRGQ